MKQRLIFIWVTGLLFHPNIGEAKPTAADASCSPPYIKEFTEREKKEALRIDTPRRYGFSLQSDDKSTGTASVTIEKDGTGSLELPYPVALKDMTVETASKILGRPSFSKTSKSNKAIELLTFDFKGLNRQGPDVFHMDIETDKNGKFKNYRLRAVGIRKPEWKELSAQE